VGSRRGGGRCAEYEETAVSGLGSGARAVEWSAGLLLLLMLRACRHEFAVRTEFAERGKNEFAEQLLSEQSVRSLI
jgi:hypothetical protein